MKKLFFLIILAGVANASGANCNPKINPTIMGSYAPCTCSFSSCYMSNNPSMGQLISNKYTYLACSCPGKRLAVALPNAAIANGLNLTYDGSSLHMTTPSSNSPVTICEGYDGCGGYCSFSNGLASCSWGSRAPSSWFSPMSINRRP